MRYLLNSYIVIFALACALMFVTAIFFTEPKEREPLVETLFDVICMTILGAGMVLLSVGIDDTLIRRIWLVATPLVVGIQLLLSWRARRRETRQAENRENKSNYWFPDIGTLILILPALAFNLWFSLGGSLAEN